METVSEGIPAISLPKVCAQFSHNWKVAVLVNPIKINATLSTEKCAFLIFSIKDSFFPLSEAAGSGAKIARTPRITITTAATSGSIR